MASVDYGKKFFLFFWICFPLKFTNLLSEFFFSLFFMEGEVSRGWYFLELSTGCYSFQKTYHIMASPLPLVTLGIFVEFLWFWPRRWNFASFALHMGSSCPLTLHIDMPYGTYRAAARLQKKVAILALCGGVFAPFSKTAIFVVLK